MKKYVVFLLLFVSDSIFTMDLAPKHSDTEIKDWSKSMDRYLIKNTEDWLRIDTSHFRRVLSSQDGCFKPVIFVEEGCFEEKSVNPSNFLMMMKQLEGTESEKIDNKIKSDGKLENVIDLLHELNEGLQHVTLCDRKDSSIHDVLTVSNTLLMDFAQKPKKERDQIIMAGLTVIAGFSYFRNTKPSINNPKDIMRLDPIDGESE